MSKRFKSYFLMFISTIAWGALLPISKLGFNDSEITPFRYLFYRFLLAGILSIPIIIHYLGKIKNKWRTIRTIILLEIIETSIALSLLYVGLSRTTALETNLISTSLPLFIIFGGIVFLKEHQDRREWIGLSLAFLGTILIALEPLWMSGQQLSASVGGNFLVIGYNVLSAIYFILAKKHYKKIPKLFVSSVSFFVGIITFAILSLVELNFNLALLSNNMAIELSSPLVLGVVIYAAIFGSIIGLTTYIEGQNGIEASEASLFTYLQPIVFIPLGYILLKESVTTLQILSLLIVVCGVYIAGRKQK